MCNAGAVTAPASIDRMTSTSRPLTHLDKNDVLAGLFGSWDDIDALLPELSPQQWQVDTCLPGWRVHDILAHIIGTESFLQGVPIPAPDGDLSDLPHVHNEIGVMNECWVRHLRDESPQAMMERFRAITAERRKVLADMDDEAWNQQVPTPAGPDTYGRFMRVRTFDCWIHEQDIRYAVGMPTAEDAVKTPTATLALDEIMSSAGYIVGKLGGAPGGSRIALELTGPLQRTVRVAVDGRAKIVDDFGGDPPSATVRLDAILFTRLAGGRTTAAEHIDAIELDGDIEVAQRIANNLKFVI